MKFKIDFKGGFLPKKRKTKGRWSGDPGKKSSDWWLKHSGEKGFLKKAHKEHDKAVKRVADRVEAKARRKGWI